MLAFGKSPMRFPFSVYANRERERGLELSFLACIFAALLTQCLPRLATAQTPTPEPSEDPPAESQPREAGVRKDAKKADKYDVDRIGQRGVGRGFNLYSAKRERELGERLAASFDRTTKIVNDAAVNDYINRLAQKVVRYSDAAVPFTIKVIDAGDIPRAYGLPGGFLYIDSALIIASDAEAELAGVIAREIAHVAARHATRALTRKHVYNFVDSMALMSGPAGMVVEDVAGVGGPLSLKKFARDAEYEADLLGIEYAYAAGYDPESMLTALEKLHAMELKRSAVFAKIPGYHFATHLPFHRKIAKSLASYPLTEERINRLQSEISRFLPDRKDYVLDTNEFQEVRSRLLAARTPVLHRHGPGENDSKGPVLRRHPESESDIHSLPILTFLPQ
jgi:Zn-dependent protease with chaperone function